ncbi:MAG: hypothetical protein ABSD50_16785 [Smithella sp.]
MTKADKKLQMSVITGSYECSGRFRMQPHQRLPRRLKDGNDEPFVSTPCPHLLS